jgi:type 1 glutamine amidotransferase
MADVLVISGSAAYADEWHDFPTTSARAAAVIADAGHSVRISDDLEAALAAPGPAALLVLNVGRPAMARPAEAAAAARAGLDAHLAAGGGLLALHSSVIALSTVPELRGLLGGEWVESRSMHPPYGEAAVERTAAEHPIATTLGDFGLQDERYSFLEVEADVTVLFNHEHDGRRHPLVWVRTVGPGRIVYDALGHDAASYDSADHQELIGRSIRWLLREA